VTIQTALLQGQKLLEEAGIEPARLTAEVLLARATGHDRTWLYAHTTDELIELWWIHYGRYLHQRTQGTPTQYITGRQEFYGREFHVTPDVLIPRPETEHVIEAALEKWPASGLCLDIGTGSGAIAVTLACEKRARVLATDISEPALRVAAKNAHTLGASVEFVACDLASSISTCGLVVSNPPYVALRDRETLQREVLKEPELALFAGNDGLDVYRRLIPEAARILRPGGWLVLEIGATQSGPVTDLLSRWSGIEVRNDLAGLPRVVLARHSS
jgi:release factor glutamine methyltransferase